jgi:predicted transcriptional regulator
MELLSSVFDPDGDHDITRDEFWHGINELKHPKHFKRKAADLGMEKKMEAVADELSKVKKEVNLVQGKLQDQFTTVQTHLTNLTQHFQQFLEAHGDID